MRRTLTATALLVTAALPAVAEVVSKRAPASVSETMDKLVAAVEEAGATVFARVDHSGGAASVGMELPEAELLIFGNPALGTPAMQDDILAGLALPLRVLVHESDDGLAVVSWEPPATLFDGLMVPEDADYVARMTGALDMLTDKAVAD